MLFLCYGIRCFRPPFNSGRTLCHRKGVEAIWNFPRPQNATAVKKFSGMCRCFRSYIPNFSNWSLHLRSLLQKDTKFHWTSVHESEFSHLKASSTSDDLILLHPNWNQEFELHPDVSKFGMLSMLLVPFIPLSLVGTLFIRNCLRLNWALDNCRPYVPGRRIKVVTDDVNLQWLKSIKSQQ